MHLSLVLVLAALPFFVAAVPLEEGSHNGLSIPLAKLSEFGNADGVVDHSLKSTFRKIKKKMDQVQDTMDKYAGYIAMFLMNTGTVHPLASKLKHPTKQRNSDKLIDHNNKLWYGTITLGTPPENFTVQFDTASGDTFFPAKGCRTTCDGHKLYDPKASSTAKGVGETFDIQFGDDSSVDGDVYTDTITLAGYKATKQMIGAAKTYSDGFQVDVFPADGVVGMGYASIANYGDSPLFQTLVSQHQVSTPVFSFYLAESDSELYIGGTNPNRYTGSFTYMPVETQGFWQVSLDNITVNDVAVVNRTSAVIDTGTTLVIGDTKTVKAIYAQIHGSKYVGSGLWTIPCSCEGPSVYITFSGKKFEISASTLSVAPVSDGSKTCLGGFGSQDGLGFWIIGGVFLRNVYTAFDLGNNQVGFASLAPT